MVRKNWQQVRGINKLRLYGVSMKAKILLVFLAVLLLAACSAKTPDNTKTGTSTPEAAAAVPVGSLNAAASGVVVAAQDAKMSFMASGMIKSINTAEGSSVQSGQVLAQLDDSLLQMDYESAKRTLRELTSPAAQAAAAEDLANAQKALEDQQDKVDSLLYKRATDTLVDQTQAQIDLAKQALTRAADAYRLVARKEDGDSRKAAAMLALTNAQMHLNDLNAKMNWYTGKPTETDAALEKAKYEADKAAVQEAEWYLAAVKGESIPQEATGANLTRLQSARSTVENIETRLKQMLLVSPIDGTLIKEFATMGESVSPGQVIFTISNTQQLHVETTDLSERDVPRVSVGQKVTIAIKALNISVPGTVRWISPVADTLGGDPVYKTVIDFEETPAGVLSGMSVDVIYESE